MDYGRQLPPGLRGMVAAELMANQRGMNQLGQMQGILSMRGMMGQQQAMEEDRARQEQLRSELANAPEVANNPMLRALVQSGNANAVLPYVMPRPRSPVVMAPGASLVDPNNPEKPLFTAPSTPKEPAESSLARLTREMNALPPESPMRAQYEAAIRKQTTHAPAPSANVTIKQETEFGKKVGGQLGEMYSDLLKSDLNAPATVAKYSRLGSLLSQVNTGKFTGTMVDLKAAAKGLGFDLNQMGVADNVAPAQAARALSNMLALELRNPAGGAGMPGAMSDKDREFLVQSIPGLENDPGAISKMIEYRVKLAQREQQVARKARDYRRKHGRFDEGFFDELSEWSNANPLFPQAASAPAAPASSGVRRYNPATGRIE